MRDLVFTILAIWMLLYGCDDKFRRDVNGEAHKILTVDPQAQRQ